jgi:hypothetical protein
VAGRGKNEKYIQNFCWKSSWERSLARPKLRCNDDIKMDLREIGCEIVDY